MNLYPLLAESTLRPRRPSSYTRAWPHQGLRPLCTFPPRCSPVERPQLCPVPGVPVILPGPAGIVAQVSRYLHLLLV